MAITGILALSPVMVDAPTKPLQQQADAIVKIGVIGAQVRLTEADGRQRTVTSGVRKINERTRLAGNEHLRIGSISKTFVATVVLQLDAERRLSLDEPVERRLPGVVRGNGNDGRKMTVRQLLQHTAGIQDDYPFMESAEDYRARRFDGYTPQEVVARAMKLKPAFAPGEGWSYSNTGYALLGLIIEKVTGRPWYTEVDRRIVQPLHLSETSWPGRSPFVPRPHAQAYNRYLPEEPLTDVTLLVDADASGGLISTTADLNRFYLALLGGDLLPKPQLRQMLSTVPVNESTNTLWPGSRYGLGIFSRPLPCGGIYYAPSGDQDGWSTRGAVTPDAQRAVTLSMSTTLHDTLENALRQESAAQSLLTTALCD
ncbi:serine hydrolase domain-containing protein [Kineosporia babensis]|uniref:Beta-lactamase family protein n=1 Tax=Kineosporia babensis TaxID=499548 RepID=A0A9X1SSY4_9ACTN|nr:serine hydrolase domain-containing protein [Kineosporia babensis]MCD5311217.1 beta-lactamase family protein [Kineosporia babensis]